jgi:chromosome segregation ATPase
LAKAEQWRAGLGEGIAKTEAQLEDVKSRILQAENRIAELKVAISKEDCPLERTQKQLELTQASLRTLLGLREATERLLATQRKAYEKRL